MSRGCSHPDFYDVYQSSVQVREPFRNTIGFRPEIERFAKASAPDLRTDTNVLAADRRQWTRKTFYISTRTPRLAPTRRPITADVASLDSRPPGGEHVHANHLSMAHVVDISPRKMAGAMNTKSSRFTTPLTYAAGGLLCCLPRILLPALHVGWCFLPPPHTTSQRCASRL